MSLCELFDAQKTEERLLKAEVARELGFFEKSIEMLDLGVSEEHLEAANLIRSLALSKNSTVEEITDSNGKV